MTRRPRGHAFERAEEIGEAHGFIRDIGGIGDRRLDRRKIVLARELDPLTGEIDEDFRLRSHRRDLFKEFAERRADLVLRKVRGASDVVSGLPQQVRHQAAVVGGGGERSIAILRFPDDEREPRRRRLGENLRGKRCGRADQDDREGKATEFHIRASSALAGSAATHELRLNNMVRKYDRRPQGRR